VTAPSLTRALARRIRAMPVTDVDLRAAERYVRDTLGSCVAGAHAPVGRLLRGSGEEGAGLEERVFLAAALSHVTETDDLHRGSVTHPGCVVVPVALLGGLYLGLRGHAVLRATLAGYEAMLRVGEALGPAHYRIFHNTATAGVFGAAAAASSLLGLDEDGWVWALGTAGTQAAGLWQFNEEGAMSKPVHAGHAAAAGLRAALLAARGITGAERILEGEKGLFRALCPDARPDAVLAEAPRWKLPETSFKPYPCCRHVHAAIDAALELGEESVPSGAYERIHVATYPAALDVTDRPDPATPHEARFSMQYAVARTLAHGRPGLEAFEEPVLGDPAVRELLGRITVSVDPALAAAYPARWGVRVEALHGDGSRVGVSRDGASGDPEHPLDDQALDRKVEGLLSWAGWDPARRAAALAACRRLVDDGPLPDPLQS